jgi:hypothetical protein
MRCSGRSQCCAMLGVRCSKGGLTRLTPLLIHHHPESCGTRFMNPANELYTLYDQWRQLTEDEGRAIDSGTWHQLENCQVAKVRLQLRITEISHGLNTSGHEARTRSLIGRLIHMERQNGARLMEKREATEAEHQVLDGTVRKLRQLRRSYVPSTRAHWESYS